MRVMVVDDYPGAAQASCMLLATMGHDTCMATTGQEALAKAATFDPEVIILDIGLPDVSGYDVARELRQRPGRRPFIAALTGWNTTPDRVHAVAAGIDQHVLKPASFEQLTSIIEAAKHHLSDAPDPA
jgi:DNA-binding response OmpR family regulator